MFLSEFAQCVSNRSAGTSTGATENKKTVFAEDALMGSFGKRVSILTFSLRERRRGAGEPEEA
jgi:hypothetical protein